MSSPIYPPTTIAKTDSTASVSFVPRIFRITVRASAVKSLFSKVTETSVLLLCQEWYVSITSAWYVPKSNSSKSPLLMVFAGIQYIVCNAARD